MPVKKDPPARPTFVPAPVGVRGSGVARLSDLSVSKKRAAEAAELEASLKEKHAVDDENDVIGSSKFFGTARHLKANPSGAAQETLNIIFDPSSAAGDELTDYTSLVADDVDKDTLPDLSSPPAACSSLQSPVKSSQQGSHFSSPGRDTEEEENVFETPKSSGSNHGKKRRSLLPHSPTNNLTSKKRRLTVTPPRGEPILAAASSPGLPESNSPVRKPSRVDLRGVCKVDQSSSVHEESDIRAEAADDERLEMTDDEEEPDNKANAQAVARGLRAKYAFTPKASPYRPTASRYNATPVPIRPLVSNTLTNQKHQSRSFDRLAPTDSPAAKAFADATAAFGKTPRPASSRALRNEAMPGRAIHDKHTALRVDSGESDDIIEDDSDDKEQTPTRAVARALTRNPRRRTEELGERKLSGSEKLLSFRYGG